MVWNLNVSPKLMCGRRGLQLTVLLEGGGTLRRWGLLGGHRSLGAMPLKGTPHSFLFASGLPIGEKLCSITCFLHDVLPH